MGVVTKIPATRNMFTAKTAADKQKRRVAGYARVSTDKDEQYTSYEAQVDYYTEYIRRNPDWSFVKVYTDEGITGTSTRNRDGFNEMVNVLVNEFFKIGVAISLPLSYNQERPQPKGQQNRY